MKVFLTKHRRTIIFSAALLATVLLIRPNQDDHYLDADIAFFKVHYLEPILLYTGIVISIAFFVLPIVKTKSFKHLTNTFLLACGTIVFCLFIFQHLILGLSLFINRQVKREALQRVYLAGFLVGTGKTKDSFFLIDLSTKHTITDRKFIDKMYKPELKQDDTVHVSFEKGLFGVAFQPKP
jgi:hypothetical protein